MLYSLDDADEHAAIAEMYRLLKPGGFALVNVAAMHMLRGDHSVLSREVRRYSRADLRSRLEARRLLDRSASPTRTPRCSRRSRSRG